MGNVVYSPNTYAGEAYMEKIWPALMKPDGLVDRGIITPRPGIKKREVLRTIDQAIEFQDPSCTFTAQADDDIDVGERYLDPVKYEVMREICFKDLRTSWDAMKLKKGSLNDYVPPADEEAALMQNMSDKIAIMNEQLYLNGKAGVTAGAATFTEAYPGLIQRLRNDSNVNKFETGNIGVTNVTKMELTGITSAAPGVVTVASTAALKTGDKVTIVDANNNQQVGGVSINEQSFTITVLGATTFSIGKTVTGTPATSGTVVFVNQSNVIEVLSFLYNNIPDAIRDKEDVKIIIPANVGRAYAMAQATVANGAGSYFLNKKDMDFLGDRLETLNYLKPNVFGVWSASNVFLGFDDSGDETNIRITDLSKTTGDDVYRYKASMKTDVNHLYGNEILLVSPETSASS